MIIGHFWAFFSCFRNILGDFQLFFAFLALHSGISVNLGLSGGRVGCFGQIFINIANLRHSWPFFYVFRTFYGVLRGVLVDLLVSRVSIASHKPVRGGIRAFLWIFRTTLGLFR